MKRSLLIVLYLTTFMAVWAIDFPSKPTINNKNLRTEELLAGYTYSLADTLTYELAETYQADYTYQDSLLETVLVKELINNEWSEIESYIYQYDEGRMTEELYQIYNSGWVNYQKESYSYNEEDLILFYDLDYWTDEAWDSYLHIDYFYDNDGDLVGEDWIYYTTGNVDAVYHADYQYDNQDRIIDELWTYTIDTTNWVNYLDIAYTRNDNNAITHEDWKYWSETAWISYLQYSHTYNNFDKIEYTSGLSLVDGQWQYYDSYSYSYNENQNLVLLLAKDWSTNNNDWVNSYQYEYDYQEIVTNYDNDAIANTFKVLVYPNPLINQVKYYSQEDLNKVSVYNLKGQRIYSSQLNNKKGTLSFDKLKEYPNGIYFFRFEDTQGNISVSKQVKLK